jgi:hypothetical protein
MSPVQPHMQKTMEQVAISPHLLHFAVFCVRLPYFVCRMSSRIHHCGMCRFSSCPLSSAMAPAILTPRPSTTRFECTTINLETLQIRRRSAADIYIFTMRYKSRVDSDMQQRSSTEHVAAGTKQSVQKQRSSRVNVLGPVRLCSQVMTQPQFEQQRRLQNLMRPITYARVLNFMCRILQIPWNALQRTSTLQKTERRRKRKERASPMLRGRRRLHLFRLRWL